LLHIGACPDIFDGGATAAERQGTLILRNEDLDPQRSRQEFASAMIEDLRWLGIRWSEGPDCGGPHGPYSQSERRDFYLDAWRRLRDGDYLSVQLSRKDLAQAASAPNDNDNDSDDEPIYPGMVPWAHRCGFFYRACGRELALSGAGRGRVGFTDLSLGPQRYIAGRDFGDFLVWRRHDVPAYQLAVVVDDAAMRITEVRARSGSAEVHGSPTSSDPRVGVCRSRIFPCELVRDSAGCVWPSA